MRGHTTCEPDTRGANLFVFFEKDWLLLDILELLLYMLRWLFSVTYSSCDLCQLFPTPIVGRGTETTMAKRVAVDYYVVVVATIVVVGVVYLWESRRCIDHHHRRRSPRTDYCP